MQPRSDGSDLIRELWMELERHYPEFPVEQIVQDGGRFRLLVAVPWCRFARGVSTREELDALVQSLEDHRRSSSAVVPPQGKPEGPPAAVGNRRPDVVGYPSGERQEFLF